MRAALESGELPQRRWESYLKLQREARWMAMRHDARLRAEERVEVEADHQGVPRPAQPEPLTRTA